MSKLHQFTLIDNTYSAEEARRVLLSLINDKIKFLDMQILSMQERFGSDTKHMEERVSELLRDRARINEVLQAAIAGQATLEIKSVVNIEVKEGVGLVASS
ncbi:MAG: hypothetical protein NWR72_19260 [Bacteroidia bacterium]|nr:hypothetical protein [Bacteroidia bacterium]